MKSNVFVSTNAFACSDLSEILSTAEGLGITNIELSGGVSVESYDRDLLLRSTGRFKFIVHNYFPPEESGLVINLASGSSAIRRASIDFCKDSIDLAAELGSDIYSVHSGYCYDPTPEQLGGYQADLPRIPWDEAKANFWEALIDVQQHGASRNVTVGIENNVVPAFNLVNGRNELDLMASIGDHLEFLEQSDLKGVGLLLDFAHLNVTANALRFDVREFIAIVEKRVMQVHLTGNDGITDQHRAIGQDEWFLPHLARLSDRPISLEPFRLEPAELLSSIQVVEDALNANSMGAGPPGYRKSNSSA